MGSYEYLACIYCGRTTPVTSLRKNLKHFENFDIDWKVIQIREQMPGPGRGITKAKLKGKDQDHGGFKLIEGQGLSIKQMLEDPAYSDLVEGIRFRLVKIVRAYIDAGIIKRSDLRVPTTRSIDRKVGTST